MDAGPCLVTGAAGFIGSHLCEDLLAAGHRVIGVDNFDPFYDAAIKRANVHASQQHPGFAFHEGDVRDRSWLAELFASGRPHTVFHLAAKAGVRPSLENPAAYFNCNVDGTLAV